MKHAAAEHTATALRELSERVDQIASDLALYLVYDRPSQVDERPDLARTHFARRCISDDRVDEMIKLFRSIGAYVQLFEGDRPFLEALATGSLKGRAKPIQIVHNGIGFGITEGGYEPGRMALLPAVADSWGILCSHSDAYTSAFALHRHHSFTVLHALGVKTPPVWHYRRGSGWLGPSPPIGIKVIAKSTYEAWSVGITEESVFQVGDGCNGRLDAIAETIGQSVTVQEFVSGREVCVPILACPNPLTTPVVEQMLDRAPHDPDVYVTIDDSLRPASLSYVPYSGPAETAAQVSATALAVFDILQQHAIGRMDFRVDDLGRPWLTDAAIAPGLGDGGAMSTSCALLGLSRPEFLKAVIGASLLRYCIL